MRIVVLDSFAADQGELPWNELAQFGEIAVYPRTPAHEVYARAAGAEAVLTNKVRLTREVIERLPDLRYVGVVATGTNVVDIDACRERHIAITNAPGYCARSVAQFVFALLLHFLEDVPSYVAAVKEGRWSESPDYCFFLRRHMELADKTIAIFGLGNIGSEVATIARAFGMNVVAAAVPGSTVTGRVPIDEALERADVVTLHCPLTERTLKMVDSSFLARLKPGAILVNTSRGALVDEPALIEALARGSLAGALLDVLTDEPPARDQPLLDPRAPWAKRLLVTPHVAWGTVEARRRLISLVARNLGAFVRGERLNRVD